MEPVWVWTLWGRILCIMANSILFANSSDYGSSGFHDSNKQIIPKQMPSPTASPPERIMLRLQCVSFCARLDVRACECTWTQSEWLWILWCIHWSWEGFPCSLILLLEFIVGFFFKTKHFFKIMVESWSPFESKHSDRYNKRPGFDLSWVVKLNKNTVGT